MNYTFNAEEFPTQLVAHFPAKSPKKHLAIFEWWLASDADAADNPVEGKSPEDAMDRTAERKFTDGITDFDPDGQARRPDDDGERPEAEKSAPSGHALIACARSIRIASICTHARRVSSASRIRIARHAPNGQRRSFAVCTTA